MTRHIHATVTVVRDFYFVRLLFRIFFYYYVSLFIFHYYTYFPLKLFVRMFLYLYNYTITKYLKIR